MDAAEDEGYHPNHLSPTAADLACLSAPSLVPDWRCRRAVWLTNRSSNLTCHELVASRTNQPRRLIAGLNRTNRRTRHESIPAAN